MSKLTLQQIKNILTNHGIKYTSHNKYLLIYDVNNGYDTEKVFIKNINTVNKIRSFLGY